MGERVGCVLGERERERKVEVVDTYSSHHRQ